MKRFVAPILLMLLFAPAAFPAEVPLGARDNFRVMAIAPGLGNRYRSNCFFPVAVEMGVQVESVSGRITVTPQSGAQSVPFYVVPFDLAPGTPYRYFVYPFCAAGGEKYTLDITDSHGRLLCREDLSMDSRDSQWYFVAILGGQGITGIAKRAPTNDSCGVDSAFVALEYLPTEACGFDCADVILWPHPDPADLNVSQVAALRQWVLSGGRIVLCIGDSWQAAASAPLLRELLPGVVTGMENTSEFAELSSSGGAVLPGDRKMAIAVLDKVRGEVLMKAGGRPLVVRGKAGFGEVTFVAFDPTKTPFAQWDGAGNFWYSLLAIGQPPSAKADSRATAAQQPYLGYSSDSASGVGGKILSILNKFEKIRPISFSFVIVFLLTYVLLVGPVDYFVLRKLKHLEWTWFTFPAIALAATVTAFVVISYGRAAQVYVNQLTVADWSADGKARRAYAASAVITPNNTYYDVSYSLPGSRLWLASGDDRGGGFGSFTSLRYRVLEHPERGAVFSDIFMPVWSPKTFCVRWCTLEPETPPLTAKLQLDGGALVGTLTNAGDSPLTNVILVHSSGVYPVGGIGPGASAEISRLRKIPYDTFAGDQGGRLGWPGYTGDQTWQSLHSLVMRASFAKDPRFFPFDCFKQWQVDDYGNRGLSFDLPSELSVRSLCDSGQAVILASSDRALHPIVASETRLFGRAFAPEMRASTVYRICVALPRS